MFRKKIIAIVTDYIRSKHQKITVLPGKCRYNYQCHANAVHDAIRKKDSSIAMVVYFDGDCPIVHFVNIHNDNFVDNTLGQWCNRYDYYLIRSVHDPEFDDVFKIHRSYRNHLKRILPWPYRWFHDAGSF